MTQSIHPFFISKAAAILAAAKAPNPNPEPLAAWAQNAERKAVAIVAASGEVVGTGSYNNGTFVTYAYVDEETRSRYGLTYGVLDMAVAELSNKLGMPLITVKRSQFGGAR